MTVKVFLGGEGKNDIGTRAQDPMGDQPGVLEVLLRKIRPDGWRIASAMEWKSIRKYAAGAANKRDEDDDDARNTLGLILHAYEEACEMLVFARDADGSKRRAQAIRRTLATLDLSGFAADYGYSIEIAGGIAEPSLEAWILHLRGLANTDEMTKAGAERKLTALGVELKSSAAYVAIANACEPLPTGTGSLCEWLDRARDVFARVIDGEP